jgi:hypothetical protein
MQVLNDHTLRKNTYVLSILLGAMWSIKEVYDGLPALRNLKISYTYETILEQYKKHYLQSSKIYTNC